MEVDTLIHPDSKVSGPILRATARLSQRYPDIPRYGGGLWVSQNEVLGCDAPPVACALEVQYLLTRAVSQ